MDKPSCLDQLKDLADSLTDRDVNLKKCMKHVKEILHDEKLNSDEIVSKLKDICNTYGK
jgi:hypothetical protein